MIYQGSLLYRPLFCMFRQCGRLALCTAAQVIQCLCVAFCQGILVSNTGYGIAHCLLASLVINTGAIIP